MKYKGYEAIQESNHHIWIGKDGKMICHINCDKPLTDEELKEKIETFITFVEIAEDAE